MIRSGLNLLSLEPAGPKGLGCVPSSCCADPPSSVRDASPTPPAPAPAAVAANRFQDTLRRSADAAAPPPRLFAPAAPSTPAPAARRAATAQTVPKTLSGRRLTSAPTHPPPARPVRPLARPPARPPAPAPLARATAASGA